MTLTLATTGVLSPVLIDDLSRLRVNHPYSGDLLQMFSVEDLVKSNDLQNALDQGYVTITDIRGQNILELSSLIDSLDSIVFSFSFNAINVAPQLLNSFNGIRSDRAPYIYTTNYIFTGYRITSIKALTANISFYIDSCDVTLDPNIAGNWIRVSTINFPLNNRFTTGPLNIILSTTSWIRGGVISGGTNATRPDYPNFEIILKEFF